MKGGYLCFNGLVSASSARKSGILNYKKDLQFFSLCSVSVFRFNEKSVYSVVLCDAYEWRRLFHVKQQPTVGEAALASVVVFSARRESASITVSCLVERLSLLQIEFALHNFLSPHCCWRERIEVTSQNEGINWFLTKQGYSIIYQLCQ